MRRWTKVTTAVAGVIAFGLTGCGGDTTEPGPSDVDIGGGSGTPPPCPFTEAQAARFAGQPLHQEADGCLFRGENGVGLVTVTTASRGAGEMTFAYQRQRAQDRSMRVTDLDTGDQAYLAAGELEAEAVVINRAGSFTLILSSLNTDQAGYERIMRDMAAALPN